MKAQEKHPQIIIPPCSKPTRGEPSFLQASATHLLYYSGCTVILRPQSPELIGQTLYIYHSSPVTAVKFSCNFSNIASIDEKGTLVITSVIEKAPNQGKGIRLKEYYRYEGFYLGARAIDWTADNKKIGVVGVGKNRFGRVASIDTGVDTGQITGVSANLSALSFRPERPYKLAVGGQQFIIKFYQGPPYKFTCSKKSHTNFINQIKYSPNGKFIISVGSDRKIVLYDGDNCEIIKQKQNSHQAGIMGIVWLDNEHFVTCGSDKKIRKWSIGLQQITAINSSDDKGQLGIIDSFVTAITYNPKNQTIFFTLLSGQIKSVDKNLTKISDSYQGHRNKIIKILPTCVPGNYIILDSNAKVLLLEINKHFNCSLRRVFHLDQEKPVSIYNQIINHACLSAQGTVLWYLTGDSIVHTATIPLLQQSIKNQINSFKCQNALFLNTLFGQGQQHAFSCFTRDHIAVYSFKQQKYEQKAEIKLSQEPVVTHSYQNHLQKLSTILIAGSQNGNIEIYNFDSKQSKIVKLTQIQSSTYKITCINNYQNTLFVGDSNGGIKVWQLRKDHQGKYHIDKIPDSMSTHTTMITGILIDSMQNQVKESQYHRKIYTFSMDNRYSIWSWKTHQTEKKKATEEGTETQGQKQVAVTEHKLSRLSTINEVHRHGILGAISTLTSESDKYAFATFGGDLLIKVHRI